MDSQPISKKLLILNVTLVILVGLMFFAVDEILHRPVKKEVVVETPVVDSHIFDKLSLQAKAVYVFDLYKKQVIFAKDEKKQLPLASLTKLMMATVASDMLSPDSKITIRKEFLTEDGDSGLAVGESWKLKNLLDFSLVVSSNDGARSIASVIGAEVFKTNDFDVGEKDFIGKMNGEAQKLGLKNMYFVNASGLDLGEVSGGYGTAENVSGLLAYMIKNKPELLEATVSPLSTISSLSQNHTARNTNTMLKEIPGLIASKTGYTALAGGNLAVAFDAGLERPIIVVVLGSTQEGRFDDVSKLVKTSLEYIAE